MSDVKLTEMVKTSGCAAKLPPASLQQVLESLPVMKDDNLVAGFEGNDDALVYRLPPSDDYVMLQTVDFFPPMVDDPFVFGQVAAANALSDIYAMGGEVRVALNLVCFPACLELPVLKEILMGGQSKVKEANGVISGGHTISDPTPKYGLCVTGFAHKDKVWSNNGSREGDLLILTKPLGVGIINTAVKAKMASDSAAKKAIDSMTTLNKRARDEAIAYEVHAATDITGFSLAGHAREMAEGSHVTLNLFAPSIPMFEEALEYAAMGLNPEGLYNNREYLEKHVKCPTNISTEFQDVLFDPQTSGGLLISLEREKAYELMEYYSKNLSTDFNIIGEVVDIDEDNFLIVK